MKIRNTSNGGYAEVTEDYGKALIEAGGWEAADAPAKPRRTRRARTNQPNTTPTNEGTNDGE
ncbi:head-to-tail connector protein [Mycobacterium phage Trike]|uniref:head-to-tail connector protein n=1 Tax=Mycobacterium phage Trike TaxID=1527536 RepID=UPI0004EF7FAE|nr:head-to-tail connector protein [Mycobacterium phage Trike]AIK69053.1 head-to-tail connector protein [Mycobacterium phage Trike]